MTIYNWSIQLIKEKNIDFLTTDEPLSRPAIVAEVMQPLLERQAKEQFYVIMLNTKNKIVGLSLISQGNLDSSVVHPREVFQPAILSSAASVILCHNHPSGDTSPSLEDIRLTERLNEAGKILGIPVLDHVIIGDGFSSLKASGHF